jgi:hypothetical protein
VFGRDLYDLTPFSSIRYSNLLEPGINLILGVSSLVSILDGSNVPK